LKDLERLGIPVRLQSVIGRWNLAEVSELVSFCEQNRAIRELKLFDISEYSELWHGEMPGVQLWRDCYVSLAGIEQDFAAKYRFVGTGHSVGGYGNPMPVYETPKGLRVRFRRTDAGAFFGPGCKQCPARSFCGDGHCNLEIGPNRLIKVCRPKEGIVYQPGQEAEAIAYFSQTRFEDRWTRGIPSIRCRAELPGNGRKTRGDRSEDHLLATSDS
jgi:MoaA/NifB/PqqE/SkfB family radical SAM enzyme